MQCIVLCERRLAIQVDLKHFEDVFVLPSSSQTKTQTWQGAVLRAPANSVKPPLWSCLAQVQCN